MTLRGHPCRMPFVARHQLPRHPETLKARRSWRYMPVKARRMPGSKPSSCPTLRTTAWGIRSKHLT